jgi:2-C-methyl-D-erythritol 4-phosphate cytidylyltransferase
VETLAIIVAAGRGERMGEKRPKAFLEIGGRSLLLRSAEAFDRAGSVSAIVAVVPPAEKDAAELLLAGVGKLKRIVVGGERRQDSVRAGLRSAPPGFDGIVLVHDAARPFASAALIDAVSEAAGRIGAAVPAVPVADTVKRARDGRIVETVDRAELFAAQTPQGFRADVLARAYDEAFRAGVTVTDEAMAVERVGLPVAIVAGEPGNRKLTTPDDLAWAEAMLQAERPR